MRDDRGATEVLGFILTFAIITTAIGLVYTSGFGGLQDLRDDEQLKNVERAFDVLASNIEDVRRYGTPSRSTEVKLRDGRLELEQQTLISVNISGASFTVNATMRPVTYISTDEATYITYEGGAVFRSSEDNSVMLSEPGWIIGDNRLIVPSVNTFRQDGPNTLSTAGTALLISQSSGRDISRFKNGSRVTVNITITSDRADAWGRYLERNGFTEIEGPNYGNVTYQREFKRVTVIEAFVGLELSP